MLYFTFVTIIIMLYVFVTKICNKSLRSVLLAEARRTLAAAGGGRRGPLRRVGRRAATCALLEEPTADQNNQTIITV